MTPATKHRPARRHWYFVYEVVCVLCGHVTAYRERRYGRKPKRWWSRHEREETACWRHF